MNKRALIISPYFPPVNAADMQRVRMSLPYFREFNWDVEVVTVDEHYVNMAKDELLLQCIPTGIKIHKVKALNKKWTSKLGLGSIALRSLWFYRQKVNELLSKQKFDLIYFSTTQFPVCILGAYWKNRFGIPYVIDMQDPWHSDYYEDKPKHERPNKYWFSYRLNKYLEPIALKQADGLISVSEKYIDDLKNRYPQIKNIPAATITFGAFEPDIKIAIDNQSKFTALLDPAFKSIVYIGRGGSDLHQAVIPVFEALSKGLQEEPEIFNQFKIYFIGTSYAPAGHGIATILPLTAKYKLEDHVIEITDRISYYHTLVTLQHADGLFIPGSDDPAYTASKIYPYLLIKKPLLTIFNSKSPAMDVLADYGTLHAHSYDATPNIGLKINEFFKQIGNDTKPMYNVDAAEKYSAKNRAKLQCDLFNRVIK